MPQSHGGTEFDELDEITEKIIGCAIEVPRNLGPGLLGHTYEGALCAEFQIQGVSHKRQIADSLDYKGR